jgi:hypothetical protein
MPLYLTLIDIVWSYESMYNHIKRRNIENGNE